MEFELLAESFIKDILKLVRQCRANLNYQIRGSYGNNIKKHSEAKSK